jgi:hypothetical protein
MKKFLTTLVLAGCTIGCGSEVTGPESNLIVRFRSGLAEANLAAGGGSTAANALALGIAGTNGTLVLDEIRVVVAEFELKITGDCPREEDDDDGNGGGGDGDRRGCGKFETPPAFITLPLEEDVVPVVQQDVPAGIYSSIEFEVEDLRIDKDGEEGNTELAELLAVIRTEFPDWPDQASMLATGTFTPTDGVAVPFRVYFDADIRIRMSFVPPMIVEADEAGAVVDITVDPRFWFFHGNGTVTDLSALDFDATGELVEFNFAMKDGFVRADHHH